MFETLIKSLENINKSYEEFIEVTDLIFEKIKHNQELDDLLKKQEQMITDRMELEKRTWKHVKEICYEKGIKEAIISNLYPYMNIEEKEKTVDFIAEIDEKALKSKKNVMKNRILFDQKKKVPTVIYEVHQRELLLANEKGQGILRKKV